MSRQKEKRQSCRTDVAPSAIPDNPDCCCCCLAGPVRQLSILPSSKAGRVGRNGEKRHGHVLSSPARLGGPAFHPIYILEEQQYLVCWWGPLSVDIVVHQDVVRIIKPSLWQRRRQSYPNITKLDCHLLFELICLCGFWTWRNGYLFFWIFKRETAVTTKSFVSDHSNRWVGWKIPSSWY